MRRHRSTSSLLQALQIMLVVFQHLAIKIIRIDVRERYELSTETDREAAATTESINKCCDWSVAVGLVRGEP